MTIQQKETYFAYGQFGTPTFFEESCFCMKLLCKHYGKSCVMILCKSIQLWFHSRVTISSNKKWSFDTCSNGNHLLCYIHIQLHTRKDGKKAIFSDIALGGLSGELSWMLFFFLAKTKTTTREPFFSPLKLAFVPAFFCLFPLLLLRGSFYPWLNSFTNCKNRSSYYSTCCSSQHLVCNCISM